MLFGPLWIVGFIPSQPPSGMCRTFLRRATECFPGFWLREFVFLDSVAASDKYEDSWGNDPVARVADPFIDARRLFSLEHFLNQCVGDAYDWFSMAAGVIRFAKRTGDLLWLRRRRRLARKEIWGYQTGQLASDFEWFPCKESLRLDWELRVLLG